MRGAWEKLPGALRNALHPAMRSALALRILSVRRAEVSSKDKEPSAAKVRKRCDDTIALAASSLGALDLAHCQDTGGASPSPFVLDALTCVSAAVRHGGSFDSESCRHFRPTRWVACKSQSEFCPHALLLASRSECVDQTSGASVDTAPDGARDRQRLCSCLQLAEHPCVHSARGAGILGGTEKMQEFLLLLLGHTVWHCIECRTWCAGR